MRWYRVCETTSLAFDLPSNRRLIDRKVSKREIALPALVRGQSTYETISRDR